ncbi:hypothetical protein HY085_03210 [Candidatus Gottesmanbacteria bacterium]|nr:hypothetical protein [Candidatus Gottesmanbacteria bacterium]
MKYLKLTAEEKEIEEAFEKGKFVPVKNQSAVKKLLQRAAVYTLGKTKNVNLRLSGKTVLKLKAKAVEEGLPYQTLAASVLHRFAMGVL